MFGNWFYFVDTPFIIQNGFLLLLSCQHHSICSWKRTKLKTKLKLAFKTSLLNGKNFLPLFLKAVQAYNQVRERYFDEYTQHIVSF